jgi:hypothetical protein
VIRFTTHKSRRLLINSGEYRENQLVNGFSVMKATDLLVQCLEKEGGEYIFGIMGNDTLGQTASLSKSKNLSNETSRATPIGFARLIIYFLRFSAGQMCPVFRVDGFLRINIHLTKCFNDRRHIQCLYKFINGLNTRLCKCFSFFDRFQ